jgi:RNA-directed DNA polymerase
MNEWHSQQYLEAGRKAGIDEELLHHAIATAEHTLSRPAPGPPILTLGHLAHLSGVEMGRLHTYVSRAGEDPYREFTIRKRPIPGQKPRFRFIAVPEPQLHRVQSWILSEVLNHAPCHPASKAFAPGSKLIAAAKPHCRAQWMIKVDVQDFFESITEIDVFRVFRDRGYQALVAFELARLCTRLRDKHRTQTSYLPPRRQSRYRGPDIEALYPRQHMGVLPQGAPTSPMLSNLAVTDLDKNLCLIAEKFGLRYSRYADDLTFSTPKKSFGRSNAIRLVGDVYKELIAHGLSPNRAKTSIVSPGARKVVLGLLVDGPHPRLTREFRSRLRMHLYYPAFPK